jgi:hypothetical protein
MTMGTSKVTDLSVSSQVSSWTTHPTFYVLLVCDTDPSHFEKRRRNAVIGFLGR